MKYTYKLIKTNDDIIIEEIKRGYWWFLSSIAMEEKHFMKELLNLDIQFDSKEAHNNYIASWKRCRKWLKAHHPELLL